VAFDDLVAMIDLAVQDHLGGETITYRPELGAPVDVVGVFSEQYVLAKGTAEAGVETIGPAVFLSRDEHAKLPIEPEDDDEPTVTIRGADYRVVERRGPDGMGGIVLALRLVV
jgi:hypothetical protein